MPTKPIYKPKPLLKRLQKESTFSIHPSRRVAIEIKNNLKKAVTSDLNEKIINRTELENNKTRKVLGNEILNQNLDKRNDLIVKWIDGLAIRTKDYRLKVTHIKQIKQLNKEIINLIDDAKVNNGPYFKKIKQEYVSELIRTIKKTINTASDLLGPQGLRSIVDYLEKTKSEIIRAKVRQTDRNDYFK